MKWWKCQNQKKVKILKCTKWKSHFLPLRPENAIPYRGRGTPHKRQNPKNAGPGGSEITKCRFYPFIWHFGHFWGFWVLSLFSLFLISIFIILVIFDFVDFVTFCVFHFFVFLMICIFWCFLSLFLVVINFWSFFVTNLGASMMTHFSPREPALPLSPFW